MKKILLPALLAIIVLGGIVTMSNVNYKHGFEAKHPEIHVDEHSNDFTDPKTLGFGDKGHPEIFELSIKNNESTKKLDKTNI